MAEPGSWPDRGKTSRPLRGPCSPVRLVRAAVEGIDGRPGTRRNSGRAGSSGETPKRFSGLAARDGGEDGGSERECGCADGSERRKAGQAQRKSGVRLVAEDGMGRRGIGRGGCGGLGRNQTHA